MVKRDYLRIKALDTSKSICFDKHGEDKVGKKTNFSQKLYIFKQELV